MTHAPTTSETAASARPLPAGVADLQESRPVVPLALDAAGVRGVRRALVLADGTRVLARVDADVALDGGHTGAHMSRFHEAVTAAVEGAVVAPGSDASVLAAAIAAEVVERQGAGTARVRVEHELELATTTPASGTTSFDGVVVIGHAVATRRSDAGQAGSDAAGSPVDGGGTADATFDAPLTRRALEVRAVGMNACPCAQGLVRASARERLLADGFTADQADRALDLIPIATHNQRATGSLTIGTAAPLDVAVIAALVRDAMSAPIHELLKRVDELAVVERAHAHPRFVEDSVRHLLGAVATAADSLGLADGDLVAAEQVNHESIHAHDVRAARSATLATLRAELAGTRTTSMPFPAGTASLDAWLAPRA